MLIEGITIGGYRSFGTPQRIGPCGKVNLFVGPNNSGKSNILLFLREQFRSAVSSVLGSDAQPKYQFHELDHHIGRQVRFTFGLAATSDGPTFRRAAKKLPGEEDSIRKILASKRLCHDTSLAWFDYQEPSPGKKPQTPTSLFAELEKENVLPHQKWKTIWAGLSKMSGGSLEAN